MDNTINLQLNFNGQEANASIQLINANIQELYKNFKYGQKSVDDLTTSISRGFNNAREILQGFQATMGFIKSALGTPVQMQVNYERAETAFSILLRSSSAAKERMKELSDFAETAPFRLPQVIEASRQLEVLTHGALSTGESLRIVGDAASGVGVDIDETAVLFGRLYDGIQSGKPVGDAMQKLQDLGIISGTARNRIEELQAQNASSVEVWKTVTDAVSVFNGSMEEQLDTTGGRLAKFEDNIGRLQTTVGNSLSASLNPLLNFTNDLISELNAISPGLTQMIATTGTLATVITVLRTQGLFPAIVSISGLQAALQTAQVQFRLAAMGGQIFAGSMTAIGTSVKGFFAALGPGGWIILGISALATAVSLLSGKTDELSESEKEAVNGADAEKIKFDLLTQTILDQNASLEARNRAKKEAQELYPGFLSNLSIENTKHSDLAKRQTAFKLMKDCIKKFYKRVRAYRIDHFFFVSRKSFQSFLISTSNIRPIIIVNIKAKSI